MLIVLVLTTNTDYCLMLHCNTYDAKHILHVTIYKITYVYLKCFKSHFMNIQLAIRNANLKHYVIVVWHSTQFIYFSVSMTPSLLYILQINTQNTNMKYGLWFLIQQWLSVCSNTMWFAQQPYMYISLHCCVPP